MSFKKDKSFTKVVGKVVGKVKEIKKILTRERIESPYDKVTIHIKGVESVGYILHPEFLNALITAIKNVNIGRDRGLRKLKLIWGSLQGPLTKVLETLKARSERQAQINGKFIAAAALGSITDKMKSFKGGKLEGDLRRQLANKERELVGLRKKQTEIISSKEQTEQKIAQLNAECDDLCLDILKTVTEYYDDRIATEKRNCEARIMTVRTRADDLYREINSFEEISAQGIKLKGHDQTLYKQWDELAYATLDFLLRLRTDSEIPGGGGTGPDDKAIKKVVVSVMNKRSIEYEDLSFLGRELTPEEIRPLSVLRNTFAALRDSIARESAACTEELNSLRNRRLVLDNLPNISDVTESTRVTTEGFPDLETCVQLYKFLRFELSNPQKKFKDHFAPEDVIVIGGLTVKKIGGAVDNKRNALRSLGKLKCESGSLGSQLENLGKTIKECEDEVKRYQGAIKEMPQQMFGVLKITDAYLSSSLNGLKGKMQNWEMVKYASSLAIHLLERCVKFNRNDLDGRSQEYRECFDKMVDSVSSPAKYSGTMPLLVFTTALHRDLLPISSRKTGSNPTPGETLVGPVTYKRYLAYYDSGVPELGTAEELRFLEEGEKFLDSLSMPDCIFAESKNETITECRSKLDEYVNHPYRKLLLTVQKK